jgi:seryl-tRNA synthetase
MGVYTVKLDACAGDMAQEEILKQAAFLSRDIRDIRFAEGGTRISFSAPEDQVPVLADELRSLAKRVQSSLRKLRRKVVFHSSEADLPHFAGSVELADVHYLGPGQAALEGTAEKLFRYFDRLFEEFGCGAWDVQPLITPTLIPSRVLARCDYFRSFPQYVTFAEHLKEDAAVIDGFRARHGAASELDDQALGDMAPPDTCLSPAVCYHVYHRYENTTIPGRGIARGVCGKCFRFEAGNLSGLRRLWDFTLREIVFLGSRTYVLEARDRSMEMMADLLQAHRLAGEIRTASDPFFIAPDSAAKTYFQLSSEAKFEVSLMLPANERLAAGSHNYHSDFFGRAFRIDLDGGGPMHSVCVGFGLERWVDAYLEQHGTDCRRWPDVVRYAPEFAGGTAAGRRNGS